jgi:starvation-inducible DNA-binding protein
MTPVTSFTFTKELPMSLLHKSSVALPEESRVWLVQHLNHALATSIDLSLQVKQAHWNIRGPQFFARHELFDKLALNLRAFADELAERAATLGGYAEGTVRLASKNSALQEYDLKAVDGKDHIAALVSRYATFASQVRESIDASESLNDPITADLLTEVCRGVELDTWFLESHLVGQ